MNRITRKLMGMGLLAGLATGCTTVGLSQRETRSQNDATYLYALADRQDVPLLNAAPMPVHLPLTMAVAQIGEVTPEGLREAAIAKLTQQVVQRLRTIT